MADQSSRGGKKKGASTGSPEKAHSSVRPGSSGTRKERGNKEPRQKLVPDSAHQKVKP